MKEATPALSPEQKRTLAAVLDEIIPPSAERQMPGAGELGVAAYIEAETLMRSPEMRPGVEKGLAAADAAARQRGAESFAALPAAERLAVLQELDSTAPGFLSSLTFPTFLGYYQNPRVGVALGIGADAPHPKGYAMEPNDLTLLDPVRQRGKKLYRDC